MTISINVGSGGGGSLVSLLAKVVFDTNSNINAVAVFLGFIF
jgi:hypothetical protein